MPETQLSEKLEFLFEPHRYKVLHGGRGGGKSHSIAKALLILGTQRRHRILCTREYQVTIRDSVHKLLKGIIDSLGLNRFYDVGNSRIVGTNGTEFIFKGLHHNVDNIKSTEGVTIAWVEEAQVVSEDSWKVLVPTIREKDSEIWVSFNPENETDPTYKRFITEPPPGSVVVELGWWDNNWITDELLQEKDYLYSVDPEAAEWVWGGKLKKISEALVLLGKVSVKPFEVENTWDGPYQGADWGFAVSPTAFVRCWVDGTVLYVSHEAYGVGVEISDTAELFDRVPDARKYVTRADNARPETISHVKNDGYSKLTACKKGPGSVEDGVAHLRSYSKIIVHPRCRHTIEETQLWSYKKNKAGDILPELVDKHNDCMDSLRYALEPLMKKRIRPGKIKFNLEVGSRARPGPY